MLPRRAKIVVCACVAACAAVWWNVMYQQHGTRAELQARFNRLGESRAAPPRAARFEVAPSAGTAVVRGEPDPLPASSADADTVRAVQRELALRGYEPGFANGVPHPITRAAVMAYEHDHGLPLTGEPSEGLLKSILFGTAAPSSSGLSMPPRPEAERLIALVQQSLAGLGYAIPHANGKLNDATIQAIRRFEAKHGLSVTGRISGPLLAKLANPGAGQRTETSTNALARGGRAN